jgi:hypothetical protein
MNDIHNIAKYNPVHKCVLVGGGNDTRKIYRLDATGQKTNLKDSPIVLRIPGMSKGTVTAVDPVSGKYIILDASAKVYSFDIMNDTWNVESSSCPIFNMGPDIIYGTIATPVSNYGVILYATMDNTNPKVHIYKHAQQSTIQGGIKLIQTSPVEIWPNPFYSSLNIAFSNPDKVQQLTILDIAGRTVKRYNNIRENWMTWTAPNLPAGMYVLKATVDRKVLTKKILLQK